MKVTILNSLPAQGIKPSHRKNTGFIKQITCLDQQGKELIVSRFYQPGNNVYCLVWIYANSYAHGSGAATGYGYEKTSTALQAALLSAGIKVTDLDGSGNCQEAINLVAKELKFENFVTHQAKP